MFLLDSLMISGIRWALETVVTAAEAEMNDDTILREQLLEAEMRRELGEIDDEAFRAIESDLLARIREIRERREGGSGPLALSDGAPLETAAGERFSVDASLAGDFHESADAAPGDEARPARAEPAAARASGRRTAKPSGATTAGRRRARTATPARRRRS